MPNTTLLRTRDASSALNLDSIYFAYKELKDWGGADCTGKFVFSDNCFDLHRAEWAIDELRDSHYEVPADRTVIDKSNSLRSTPCFTLAIMYRDAICKL